LSENSGVRQAEKSFHNLFSGGTFKPLSEENPSLQAGEFRSFCQGFGQKNNRSGERLWMLNDQFLETE